MNVRIPARNYQVVHADTIDERGIDVAFLHDQAFVAPAGERFLVISWPLGTEVPGGFMSDPHTRMFVRLSTTGDLPASDFATTFDGRATLPTNARDTGYHRNGWHLWVVDAAIDRAVWLVHEETVERWPAAKEIIACG